MENLSFMASVTYDDSMLTTWCSTGDDAEDEAEESQDAMPSADKPLPSSISSSLLWLAMAVAAAALILVLPLIQFNS